MGKRFSVSCAGLLVASLLAGGCGAGAGEGPARISHIVLFKMRSPADARALETESRRKLTRIPGVASYHSGHHLDIGRQGVESDYDVCLTVGFDSVEDYRAYLEHPLHVELVEDWRDRWAWVRIYDVEDATR